MKKIFICLLIVFLVACNQGIHVEYPADYPYYDTADAMTNKADYVFEGKILESNVYKIIISSDTNSSVDFIHLLLEGDKLAANEYVYTVYDMKVFASYKGDLTINTIVRIKLLGGKVGADVYTDLSSVSFNTGEKVLLFAVSFNNNLMPWSLINPEQGYYQIINNIYIKHDNNHVAVDTAYLSNIDS